MDHDIAGQYYDYFDSCVDLRYAIEKSFDDSRFSCKYHGCITYIVDSNVVKFFLNPSSRHERSNVALFQGKDEPHLSYIAIITAELLFSRHLPGQWGAPAFISSSHAEELSRIVRDIVNDLRKSVNHDAVEQQVEKHIRGCVEEVWHGGLKESLRALFTPCGIEHFAFNEAQMFKRLFDEDLLRPLHLDPLADLDVLEPDPHVVAEWTDRIRQERQEAEKEAEAWHRHEAHAAMGHHSTQNRAASRANRNQNIIRDAKTIAQLLLLNDKARATSRPTRYVLVTMDQCLYRACAKPHNQDDFFALRRPIQYAPTVNVSQMPNEVKGVDLIIKIRDALDSFLSFMPRSSPKYPENLPMYYGMPKRIAVNIRRSTNAFKLVGERFTENCRSYGRSLSQSSECFDHLCDYWQRMSEDAALINAELLRRRASVFGPLVDLLHRADIEAVVNFMARTIDEVDRTHVSFTIRHNLAGAIRNQSNKETRYGLGARAVLLVRSSFEEFTRGQLLIDYLDNIINTGRMDQLELLNHELSCESDWRTLFLAGCIAFRAEAWEEAQFFAERALAHIRAEQEKRKGGYGENMRFELRELLYFSIVAMRYASMNEDALSAQSLQKALQTPMEALQGTLDESHNNADIFAYARACKERGWFSLLPSLLLEGDAGSKSAAEDVDNASAWFERASSVLAKHGSIPDSRLQEQLLLQTRIGLASCVIQRALFQGERIDNRYPFAFDSLIRTSGPLPRLYCVIIELYKLLCESNLQRRFELMSSTKQQIDTLVRTSSDLPIRFDQLFLTNISRLLAAHEQHLNRCI